MHKRCVWAVRPGEGKRRRGMVSGTNCGCWSAGETDLKRPRLVTLGRPAVVSRHHSWTRR